MRIVYSVNGNDAPASKPSPTRATTIERQPSPYLLLGLRRVLWFPL